MKARATLTAEGRTVEGVLTEVLPDGDPVLMLDDGTILGAADLPPDHLIELHGGREVKDILLAAGKAGFTVTWPRGD
ncbi:MAG: hypothetical protein ACYTG0_37880 [Planctomycetota bacterium]|jgi:hypothetical protein